MNPHLNPHRRLYELPPVRRKVGGGIRTVGVEVEFVGLSPRASAHALAAELGGVVKEEDPHAFHLRSSLMGDLIVELDIRHVHPHRRDGHPLPRLPAPASAQLGSILSPFVPRELITGPLPIDGLATVDRAIEVLRRAGARGRGATLFDSLGLHFNVAPPAHDADTLVRLLKAFLILEPWLRRKSAPTFTARVFAPPQYPDSYVRQVLSPDYRPDLAALAEDYLAANPTRKRSLDLLPLFLYQDPDRVGSRLVDKVNRRAALHYRLPRAHLGEAGWSAAPDWNRWVAVERLSTDPDRLDALGRKVLAGEPVECPVECMADDLQQRQAV